MLHITQHSARLYVTEAYDLFGLWHKQRTPKQKYRSTITDGAPWQIVRWKNNDGYTDVQFIGELKLNKSFQPSSSKDAVIIYDDKLHIRLPWTLLNIVDPSKKLVFHVADESISNSETRVSDGIAVSIFYKNKMNFSDSRFSWENWDRVTDADISDELKVSYWSMYDNLIDYNTPAIAFPDTYEKSDNEVIYKVDAENGLLRNDFDLDGWAMFAVLVDAPSNGFVELNADGSFVYIPRKGFKGVDRFKYAVYDGKSLSASATVTLNVKKRSDGDNIGNRKLFTLYPNPATDFFVIKSEVDVVSVRVLICQGNLFLKCL
jgi:hypothetical protein